MRKAITILSALTLSAFVIFGQQEGDYGGDLSGDFGGGYYSEPAKDTTFILNWTFGTGMPSGVSEEGNVSIDTVSYDITYLHEDFDTSSIAGWTKEGGVDLKVHPTNGVVTDSVLEITVSGGGVDYIQKTIANSDEYWYSCQFLLTDADTAGWKDDERVIILSMRQSSGSGFSAKLEVYRSSGALKWKIIGVASLDSEDMSTEEVVTDTWYDLLLHIKKETSESANDGIMDLKVDGTEVAAFSDWDSDITVVYSQIRIGNAADNFDCIFYTDNAFLGDDPNPGLNVTKETSGDDCVSVSVGDESEYWFDLDYTLKPWHSGWDDTEYWRFAEFVGSSSGRTILSVKDDSGTKKWFIWYEYDTSNASVLLSTGPTDNKMHALGFYSRRSSAAGADDGYMEFTVDGDSTWAVKNVDNDAAGINAFILGDKGSGNSLVATAHIDNVKFWNRAGLP